MLSFLGKSKELVLDILFPPVCSVCKKPLKNQEKESSICLACFSLIPIRDTLTCPECGSRFADNIKVCHKDTSFRLAAASSYDSEIVKNLVWKLKYEKKTFAANPLGEIMLAHLKLLGFNERDPNNPRPTSHGRSPGGRANVIPARQRPKPQAMAGGRIIRNFDVENSLIIPLPLHRARERERGFNQSRLIAEYIGARLGLPVKPDILKRIKNTKPQAESKDFDERKKNIENSFEVARPELVQKKNIILMDDVFTSGATVSEAVKALRARDAGKIIALVAAKAGF